MMKYVLDIARVERLILKRERRKNSIQSTAKA